LQFLQALQFFDPVQVDFSLITGIEEAAIEQVIVPVNMIIDNIFFINIFI